MLRDYQNNALDAVRKAYLAGIKQQVLVMSTGLGKTVCFANLPDRVKDILPNQMLVVAHRTELLDQAIDKIRYYNPSLRVDKEMAEHKADSNADVIVASVASIGRKGTKRIDRFNWDTVDKIVIDEVHHSTANSYLNVLDTSGVLKEGQNKLLLGCTATPQRSDGKALAAIYKRIVYEFGLRKAIESGWLVDVKGIKIGSKTSLDKVKTVAGDFAQNELADAVNNPQRNQLVVKAWLDHAQNRQTLVFCADIRHSQDVSEMFKQYGVKAEVVWGVDPERADKIARLGSGDIQVLCNCNVLTEGFDMWQVGCIVLARPTKSSVLYVQMCGRSTRLQEGTGNLIEALKKNQNIKKDALIIDIADVSSKHSLVTLPTLMGMNGTLDLSGKSLVGAIKSIEEAQKQYSHIDFSSLKNIDQLQTFIESVNLFEIKFPPEVEECSKLSWHTSADGGFILLLPNREEVRIKAKHA